MSVWLNSDDRMHIDSNGDGSKRGMYATHTIQGIRNREVCSSPPKKEDQMVQGLQVTWFSKLLDRKPTQKIVQRK